MNKRIVALLMAFILMLPAFAVSEEEAPQPAPVVAEEAAVEPQPQAEAAEAPAPEPEAAEPEQEEPTEEPAEEPVGETATEPQTPAEETEASETQAPAEEAEIAGETAAPEETQTAQTQAPAFESGYVRALKKVTFFEDRDCEEKLGTLPEGSVVYAEADSDPGICRIAFDTDEAAENDGDFCEAYAYAENFEILTEEETNRYFEDNDEVRANAQGMAMPVAAAEFIAETEETTVSAAAVDPNEEVAAAGSGDMCGENLTWTLDENGTLTIDGTGAMSEYAAAKDVPWYNSRASVRRIVIGEGVTSLCKNAFYGCGKALKEYMISASALTMGIAEPDIALRSGSSALQISYKSSKSSVVAVDAATGKLTAKKTGTATVTATLSKNLDGSAKKAVAFSCKVTVKAKPTGVTITPEHTTLAAGESADYKISFKSSKQGGGYSVVSSNEAVVRVEDDEIIACGQGSATLSVTTYNGCSSEAQIEVLAPVSEVILPSERIRVPQGCSVTLSASVNADSVGNEFDWNVATQGKGNISLKEKDTYCVIKGLKIGTATVTAQAYNGVSKTCTVEVIPAIASITAGYSAKTLGVGETLQLQITAKDSKKNVLEGIDTDYTYTSSNKNVATVSGSGLVTAKAKGSATITVKSGNGKKTSVKLTVLAAPTSVKSVVPYTELSAGDTMTVSVTFGKKQGGSYELISEDERYLKVDGKKLVAVADSGIEAPVNVAVTAKTYNGLSTAVTVTVLPAVKNVSFEKQTLKLPVGSSYTFSARADEGTACHAFNWGFKAQDGSVTSKSKLATIKANGASATVKAVKAGKVSVAAQAYNGVEAVCEIEIVSAISSVSAGFTSKTIGVGETLKLDIVAKDSKKKTIENIDTKYTFTSSNKKVATVSADGVVTAQAKGSATIRIKSYNGKSTSVKLTVKAAPASISITPERCELSAGDSAAVKASFGSGQQGGYTLTSDNENVVRIEGTKLIAVAEGTANISAVTYNGVTCEAPTLITVYPHVAGVHLSEERTIAGAGDSFMLTASAETGVSAYTWSVISGKYVTVTADGKVSISKKAPVGTTAVVKAASYDPAVYATCEVTVGAAPTGAKVSALVTTLGVGQSVQLNAQAVYSESEQNVPAHASFTYTSSKSSVASVSAAGLVTAKKVGTATVTVKTVNGKTAKLTIKVVKDKVMPEVEAPERIPLEGSEYRRLSVSIGGNEVSPEYYTVSCTPAGLAIDEMNNIIPAAIGAYTLTVDFTGLGESIKLDKQIEVYDGKSEATVTLSVPESVDLYDTITIDPVLNNWNEGVTVAVSVNGVAVQGNTVTPDASICDTGKQTDKITIGVRVSDGWHYDFERSYEVTVNCMVEDGGMSYAITGAGTLKLLSGSKTASAVTVPETVGERSVTAIGEEAFAGNTALAEIDLPATVEVIGARAFKGCTALKNMK